MKIEVNLNNNILIIAQTEFEKTWLYHRYFNMKDSPSYICHGVDTNYCAVEKVEIIEFNKVLSQNINFN